MPHKPIYGTDFLDDLKANWGEEWGIKSPFWDGSLRCDTQEMFAG